MFVSIEHAGSFACLEFNRGDFRFEPALRLGFGKPGLRAQRPGVLGLSAYLVLLDKVFSVPAGMLAGKRIVQAIIEQAVYHSAIAQPVSVPGPAQQERRLVHIFHAACDGAIGMTKHHLLGSGNDRLCAGAADAVDCHGRDADRQARAQRRLACRVHPGARLQNLAHDYSVDLVRREP